jgi:Kef-type K+ transport system membrane component KefB
MEIDLPQFELPLFTNLLILLVVARIFGELFERMKQPAMIGEIIAGIVLGPSFSNLIHRTEEIKVISELGIFLLVILAGLEINVNDIIRSLRGKNLIISALAFAVPMLCGYGIGVWWEQNLITSVFIGLCVAITALPVSIRILMDLGQINSETGKQIISVAIFDDVLALSMLGVLLNLHETNYSFEALGSIIGWSILKLFGLVIVIAACYYGIQKLTQKEDYVKDALDKVLGFLKGREPLFAIFFAFILLFSTLTEALGLHFIIGAFFGAMLVSKQLIGEKHIHAIESTTSSLAMGFLAPIFFAGIGLEFSIGAIDNPGLLIAVVLISYASKILGGYVGSRLAGLQHKPSLLIGIGLNARGIMELVIANIAYKAGLISVEIFSILVVMGVFTTLTTPFMLKRGFARFISN